jgi:hypothetical protein
VELTVEEGRPRLFDQIPLRGGGLQHRDGHLVAEEDEDAVCGFKSTVGGTRRLYSKQRERGNGGLTRDQLEEWGSVLVDGAAWA